MSLRTVLLALTLSLTFVTATYAATAEKSKGDYTDPVLGIDFVLIEGGSFLMGDLSGRGEIWERPAHQVTLKDFYIGMHEVTFAQYDKYCEATGKPKPNDRGWGRGDKPVMNVSWEDGVKFAAWLSKKSKRTFRLPTEAEWEYAARAGTSTPYWWGHKMRPGMANCRECASDFNNRPAPVGSFAPNPWGLYDMNGNVWEWVSDIFHGEETGYQGAPDDGSSWDKGGDADWKLYRGGSYEEVAFELRSSSRCFEPSQPRPDIGLRLVLEP